MELMDDDDEDGMEGFNGVATPFKTVSMSVNPIEFTDIGSQASRQAANKNKVKSALSPNPKIPRSISNKQKGGTNKSKKDHNKTN
eukprot:3635892-Ditylum_brightwellii.AAC.1